MKSIQALREQRAEKAKAAHELAHKEQFDPATDGPAYDALLNEVDDLDTQIKRINDINARVAEDAITGAVIEAAAQHGHDKKSKASSLFAKWLRVGNDGLSDEDKQAIRASFQAPAADIRNTMSTTTPSQGGYTVPIEVANQVLDALKAFGGMRAVAEVIRTETGHDINYPTSDGTSEVGELLGQNAQAATADISFGVKTLSVYKYSSKIVPVPIELLQDSNVDIEGFIRGRLITRLGRITNTHFTTGTGTGQPNGIVTAAGSGKVGLTGQTVTVIYDDLVDLVHSVDPAYRLLGRCHFMLNDASLKVIRKIKDGQSRPIFVPGYEEALPVDGTPGGAPDSLLGYPVQINQDVATMAANAKSILFGDFSYYKIRDAMDVAMFRFADSVYMSLGQVAFLAFLRSGGQFVDVGGAVKYYQNSAT